MLNWNKNDEKAQSIQEFSAYFEWRYAKKTSSDKLIIADSQYASEDCFPLQTVSNKSDIIGEHKQ